MSEAKSGDTVRIHYTGTLEDGTVFDSSEGQEPLEFTLGSQEVIPGFEQAVEGMQPGEKKEITIAAADAYGSHQSEYVLVVDREDFPENIEPEPGQELQLSQGGQSFVVRVTDVTETSVTLDANHPLAGQDLTFALELVEIV